MLQVIHSCYSSPSSLLQPQRVVHLLTHSSLLPAVIKQHSTDNYSIVYVSTFRNATGHYFNLILDDQPGVKKFQVANCTDRDIDIYDKQASRVGFCKTFQFKYHLPGDHYPRSIAVYVKEQDCKYVFTDGQKNFNDINDDYETKQREGYRTLGISSYEGYREVQYLSRFKKSNVSVLARYFEHRGFKNFRRRLTKLSNAGYVTYYVGGMYSGEPGVGPTTFAMMSYRTKKQLDKDSVKVLEYKNMISRHFSQELVQKAIAKEMKKGMLPVSSFVWYKSKKSSKVPTLYIVFVKEGLEEFD